MLQSIDQEKILADDNYRTIILYKRKLGENDYGTQGPFSVSCRVLYVCSRQYSMLGWFDWKIIEHELVQVHDGGEEYM